MISRTYRLQGEKIIDNLFTTEHQKINIISGVYTDDNIKKLNKIINKILIYYLKNDTYYVNIKLIIYYPMITNVVNGKPKLQKDIINIIKDYKLVIHNREYVIFENNNFFIYIQNKMKELKKLSTNELHKIYNDLYGDDIKWYYQDDHIYYKVYDKYKDDIKLYYNEYENNNKN